MKTNYLKQMLHKEMSVSLFGKQVQLNFLLCFQLVKYVQAHDRLLFFLKLPITYNVKNF